MDAILYSILIPNLLFVVSVVILVYWLDCYDLSDLVVCYCCKEYNRFWNALKALEFVSAVLKRLLESASSGFSIHFWSTPDCTIQLCIAFEIVQKNQEKMILKKVKQSHARDSFKWLFKPFFPHIFLLCIPHLQVLPLLHIKTRTCRGQRERHQRQYGYQPVMWTLLSWIYLFNQWL